LHASDAYTLDLFAVRTLGDHDPGRAGGPYEHAGADYESGQHDERENEKEKKLQARMAEWRRHKGIVASEGHPLSHCRIAAAPAKQEDPSIENEACRDQKTCELHVAFTSGPRKIPARS